MQALSCLPGGKYISSCAYGKRIRGMNPSYGINRLSNSICLNRSKERYSQKAMQRNGSIIMQPVGDIYTPVISVGLNANSNAKNLGKEFITILLSKEAQQVDSLEGFPCNINSEEGTYTMPLKGEMRQLFQVKEQLKTPINLDRVMKELIMQNAQAYFDDKISEKEAVFNITENIK